MKCAHQYPASKFAIKALNILVNHPGLTAQGFAAICYPSRHRAGWLGAMSLYRIVNRQLIKVRWEPPFNKPGRIKPRKKYYVTNKGFAVYESYRRQGYSENGDPADTA
jgi:hypothetical protein